jgi:hypothetical protein
VLGGPSRLAREQVVYLARLEERESGRTCQRKCEHRERNFPRPIGNAHAQTLPFPTSIAGIAPCIGRSEGLRKPFAHEFGAWPRTVVGRPGDGGAGALRRGRSG